MLKSKITASVLALSIAIPAMSWGSYNLEDERSNARRSQTNPRVRDPITDIVALSTGFLMFTPLWPACVPLAGYILYRDYPNYNARTQHLNPQHIQETNRLNASSNHNNVGFDEFRTDTKKLLTDHSILLKEHDRDIDKLFKEFKY